MKIDLILLTFIFTTMSISLIPNDCLRLICVYSNYIDMVKLSQTCRRFHQVISAFWTTRITRELGISPQEYYRLYQESRDDDKLMREWISPGDMERFYSAIVRFFYTTSSLDKARKDATSDPNDIWICGQQRSSGKWTFTLYIAEAGLRRQSGIMNLTHGSFIHEKTGNRLVANRARPGDDFKDPSLSFGTTFRADVVT